MDSVVRVKDSTNQVERSSDSVRPEHTSLRLFSSESVTQGHPDKICDQISDAILDAMLRDDPNSRTAIETLVTTGLVHVAGEVATEAYVEIPEIVRNTILSIGYDSSANGFDGARCGVSVSIGQQSSEISAGVFTSLETREGMQVDDYDVQGAGDQGIIFGYASEETSVLMPAPIWLAHLLSAQLTTARKDGAIPYLRPDGKTQVTIGYDRDTPVSVDSVVISSQHAAEASLEELRADLLTHVIKPVLDASGLDTSSVRCILNPGGEFVTGGPVGDTGVTGRKIVVDTYGGMARHGGGAFSGKDSSKVDRSAAYAMRWVAKNVVAAGLARRVEIQVAYAIGMSQPIGIHVETFGTETVDPMAVVKAIREIFDLRPLGIIHALDLKRPIYQMTAANGHFGRENEGFNWERTDRVEELRSYFNA
jgi:S-adenosylmethionine synthetase